MLDFCLFLLLCTVECRISRNVKQGACLVLGTYAFAATHAFDSFFQLSEVDIVTSDENMII